MQSCGNRGRGGGRLYGVKTVIQMRKKQTMRKIWTGQAGKLYLSRCIVTVFLFTALGVFHQTTL